MSDVAFLACFTECASVMIDHGGMPGFFPMLANTFGPGAFDVGGTRFQLFLSIRSATACEFRDAWARNQHSIHGENSSGPFDVDADQAGRDSTHRMQHRMTEQIERVRRDRLHRDMLAPLARIWGHSRPGLWSIWGGIGRRPLGL